MSNDGVSLAALTVFAGMITSLAVALSGIVWKMFLMYDAGKDREMGALRSERDNLLSMLNESVGLVRLANNARRKVLGEEPLPVVADVVPEHSSPVTDKEQDTADLATVRAEMTLVRLDMGLPPRTASEEPAESETEDVAVDAQPGTDAQKSGRADVMGESL